VLHKSFLNYYSEYFHNDLRGAWKEAKEKTIPLVIVEPGTFKILANWLYSQELLRQRKDWVVVAEIKTETLY
jgi:hypothetical protein